MNSIDEGWWPPKYIVIADWQETMGCKDNLLKTYNLVKAYRSPLEQWKDSLKFEAKVYVIY